MRPVTMKQAFGAGGDCLMAAIASILECELETLPVITVEREDQWHGILTDALALRGFRLVEFGNIPPVSPPGFTIAVGLSPRTAEVLHAVVALDGHVVHDPHPSADGVKHIDRWYMLIPFAREPQRTGQHQQSAAL